MLPDPRLLAFTVGVRGRIAFAVAAGLAAALVGIGRLGRLSGWLIAGVFAGEAVRGAGGEVRPRRRDHGAPGVAGVLAQHDRAPQPRPGCRCTCASACTTRWPRLGPAWFGLERTGKVLVSIVEGVEQLETWFGPVPAPALRGRAHPDRGIRIPRVSRPSGRAGPHSRSPSSPSSPPPRSSGGTARAAGGARGPTKGSRPSSSTPSRGLATLKAFGQSGARGRRLADRAEEVFRTTMWVLAVNSLGRGITDVGLAVGAAVVLGYGAFRVEAGAMTLAELLIVLMMGIEVFRPQRDLRALLHQGLVGTAAAEGVLSLLAGRPIVEYSAAEGSAPGEEPAPTVEFEAVGFTYPGARRPAHRGPRFPDRRRGAGGIRRGERSREDVDRPPAASPLRSGRGVGAYRGPRPPRSLRPRRPRADRGRQPGHTSSFTARSRTTCASAGRTRPTTSSPPPRARRMPTNSSRGCRTATGQWSANAGCGSPAGSASGSRSPAPSSATPPSWCWTRR